MAQPLYRLWMVRPKEAWYALSDDEQRRHLAQATEALEKVGGRLVMACDAGWATEQWSHFGLEEYPDLDAVQRHQQILGEIKWLRYFESMTLLGTQIPAP
jgi:hypothetical protein